MSKLAVWIFHPSKSIDKRIQLLIKSISTICHTNHWDLIVREYRIINSRGIISGPDSQDLYRKIHRSRCAVISIQPPNTSGPIVMARPTKVEPGEMIDLKKSISLRQLCINKSFFYKMRWDRDCHNWKSGFSRWFAKIGCEGVLDPICLPFPVFYAEDYWPKRLRKPEFRKEFNLLYGTNDRKDLKSLIWKTKEQHGFDVINIAGFELPRGYHWNVNVSLETARIYTPTEVWEISDYVNVTPDACIRGRSPYAKKLK